MDMILPDVDWKNYISTRNQELLEYLSKTNNSFISKITNRIISAQKRKLKSIILFKFANSDFICAVDSEDYNIILDRLMLISKQMELYENCAVILKHQKSVISKKRKLTLTN